MTEISAMYEALDNMDDYALMANVKPIGPHKVLTDAIAELQQLRQRVQELEKENSIERNLRIGVEAGFDCANEELGRLKTRIENLMLDSEQWRTDCQSYCDAMHRREAAITSLQAERDALKKAYESAEESVLALKETRNRLAEERDKATQYWQIAEERCDALKQQRDELVAALEMIAGKRYCLDALMSNSDIAKAAIASVKEKQNAAD